MIEQVLERVRGAQKVAGGWVAYCPGHEDREKRSLSIKLTDDRVLLHCFVGCQLDDVLRGLQLEAKDLFADSQSRSFAPATPSPERKILARYPYTDEAGTVLYEVVRYEPKDFRQRRPDGTGGWTWSLGDVRRVLYRLPDLLECERVFFVEGEKDVERLFAVGVVATTACAGAAAWRKDYATDLAQIGVRELVIIPDNDEPGEKYASVVAAAARAAGLRVKIVRLPGVQPKGDVSNWFDAGGTPGALAVLVDDEKWAEPAETALPEGVLSAAAAVALVEARLKSGQPKMVRTPFAKLNQFLCGGFEEGELTYLASRPGIGKTAMVLGMAKAAAFDGEGVLVISREMRARLLMQRMIAQDAQISHAALRTVRPLDLTEQQRFDTSVAKLRKLPLWINDMASDIATIERVVREIATSPALSFVILDYLQLIDPPPNFRGDRRAQIEFVSKRLKALAVDLGIPIVCVCSLTRTKTESGKDRKPVLSDLRESGQLEHDADVVFLLHRELFSPDLECIIAKNRSGSPGVVDLQFFGETMTVTGGMP